MDTFKMLCRVLAVNDQSFKGRDGEMIAYFVATVRLPSGSLVAIPLKGVDLSSQLDQDVELTFALTSSSDLKPKLRIV